MSASRVPPRARPQQESGRRSLVPASAGRSLWLAALWTGAGTAVLCATIAIIAVAICWLPASGTGGHAHAAIHAGLLTFLAALHGGITIDAEHAQFLPLGLLLIVAAAAYRAGLGLADVARERGDGDPVRLGLALGVQCAGFAACCLLAVPFADLGTSEAPFLQVGLAALVLFGLAAGLAFARATPLGGCWAARLPSGSGAAARGAAVLSCTYLAAGAVLVAGALIVNHSRVQELSAQVGGGWGGIPLLLLGILAAPNAVIAGVAYLAGPGFAVGVGTSVTAFSSTHGLVPAFPVLGALPSGHGANVATWCLVAVTPVAAGLALARLAIRADGWAERFRVIGGAAAISVVAWAVLGWQAGGGIGAGRLRTVGASAWQLGPAVAVPAGLVACAALGLSAAFGRRQERPRLLRVLGQRAAPARQDNRASRQTAAGREDELAG